MSKTIITIDDSMSIREVVKLALSPLGYEVHCAADGAQALQMCQQRKFDLVFTDLNMPRMNGIQLITQLRQAPNYRFTPIVMVTTESQDEMKMAGKRAGATGWITKPFTPPKLQEIARKLCPNN